MHKGIILLTQAESREEALNKVNTFLEGYQHIEWDWYTIGGRWHNTLAPSDKLQEFEDWIREAYKHVFGERGYRVNDLENEHDRKIIQEKWEEIGLTGKNTYYSAYGFEVADDVNNYNVIPLKDCITTVQSWLRNLNEEKEKVWKQILKARRQAKTGKYDMSHYYAGTYSKIYDFSFDSNVYDIDEEIGEKLPEDFNDNWWAVMVDLHN